MAALNSRDDQDRAYAIARAAVRPDGLGVAPTFAEGQVLAREYLRLVAERARRALLEAP